MTLLRCLFCTLILTSMSFLLLRCSSVTTVTGSSIHYEDEYEGPKKIEFTSANWIINTPETEGISEESSVRLNTFLIEKCAKHIGPEARSSIAARNTGIIPPEVSETSPKMMASLSDESYQYLLHMKITGNDKSGGGVSYGSLGSDNSAIAELFVYSIPEGSLLFRYFVRATETSGSDNDFDDDNGDQLVIRKSSYKIQRSAVEKALNKLKKKSNLPF